MTQQERRALVAYRMENAATTLQEVRSHCENGFWNTAINRMYYACYYAASALLISKEIPTRTHEGVRRELGRHFVLTGIMEARYGRFYSQLFGKRSKGDYEDFFNNDRETTEAMLPQAEEFIAVIGHILQADGWMEASDPNI